nr:hypothetical protein [Xenorhabdus bovienii]
MYHPGYSSGRYSARPLKTRNVIIDDAISTLLKGKRPHGFCRHFASQTTNVPPSPSVTDPYCRKKRC